MSEGQGWVLSSPAILCPPKCSDSVPLTPTWATAASESVPSSNSKSRPSPPQLPPISGNLVASLQGLGWEEGSPSQTLLSLPPSSPTTGLGPQRPRTSVLAQAGLRPEGWSHTEGKRLLCSPAPSPTVGFRLGLPQEQGFWARVCKAIFLCGGRGEGGGE